MRLWGQFVRKLFNVMGRFSHWAGMEKRRKEEHRGRTAASREEESNDGEEAASRRKISTN
jgi:hypothetical protein